jgi:hypothetical protein
MQSGRLARGVTQVGVMRTAWTKMLLGGALLAAITAADPSRASTTKSSRKATPPPTTAFGGRPSGWTVVADAAPDVIAPPGEAVPVMQVASEEPSLTTTAASPVVSVGSTDGPSLGVGYAYLLNDGAAVGAGGDALTCLTQAVYFEARGEPVEGQEAVAQVVMNRTRQFSFTCNGALGTPTELDAWRRANEVASRALAGFVYAPVKDATHFHATWVNPYWSGSLTRLGQIGGHIFYH